MLKERELLNRRFRGSGKSAKSAKSAVKNLRVTPSANPPSLFFAKHPRKLLDIFTEHSLRLAFVNPTLIQSRPNTLQAVSRRSVEKRLAPIWQTPASRSERRTNRSQHPRHTATFSLHGVRSPQHEARGAQHEASRSLRDGGTHSQKRETPLSQRSAHFMKQTPPFIKHATPAMKHATPAMRKTAHSTEPAIFTEKSAAHSLGGIIYSHR